MNNVPVYSDGKLIGEMVPVPPPDKAPVDDLASSLGLVDGLSVEINSRMYRCSECSKMQPAGSLMVWVPDGVRRQDPAWAITEFCRQNARNGQHSGWCIDCAPKKLITKKSAWQRFLSWF